MNSAHLAAAGLAGLGALTLQFGWPVVFTEVNGADRVSLAAVLLAATGYLLATGWFHASLARRQPAELGQLLGRLGRGLACDFIVGFVAGTVLANGHTTALLEAGLWLVPPTLVAACAASALVELFALRNGRFQFSPVKPPAHAAHQSAPPEWPRLLLTAALVVLLFTLN